MEVAMPIANTSALVRVVRLGLRHADERLVRGAARNAALEVAAREQRHLEDARTMRDLRRVCLAMSAMQ